MALVFVAARGLSPAVASGATLQLRCMAFLVVAFLAVAFLVVEPRL